jgi:HEAT repeat protein
MGGVVAAACVAVVAGFVAGCIPQPKRGVDSPEPALRLEAMREAAATKDRDAIVPLIGSLDSDDPATRLLAIRTLEAITGLTHGYDYAGAEKAREEAVKRWVAWAEAEGLTPAAGSR